MNDNQHKKVYSIDEMKKIFPFGKMGLLDINDCGTEKILETLQSIASDNVADAFMMKPVNYKDSLWAYELAFGAIHTTMNVLNNLINEIILVEDENQRKVLYGKLLVYATVMNNQSIYFG